MRQHELWRDRRNGDVWAVELNDGIVTACDGPLHWSDLSLSYLDGYSYRPDGALAIERDREHFDPLNELDILAMEGATE